MVQLRAGGELRLTRVFHGSQASSAASPRDNCGERQRWECCAVASIRDRPGKGIRVLVCKGSLRQSGHAAHTFQASLTCLHHLNVAQGVASTGCASSPGLDGAHWYLPVKFEEGSAWAKPKECDGSLR